jgi:outer membrane protein OmpA-like peptidoglycan-associated protein
MPGLLAMLSAVVLTGLLVAGGAGAASPDRKELRATLFGAADEALKSANDHQASLLAPGSYAEGAESYQRAESILESGGGIEAIQRNLTRAQSAFARAALAASAAQRTFATALEARSDAANAEAERFSAEEWRDAEAGLTDASTRLERGREESARRRAAEAEELYRSAELTAIQANYLNPTRSLLEAADKLRAQRYAPLSYQRARELLNEAETSLTENRYDTDQPRNIAQLAEHNAHHAIYVARLERRIRDNDSTLEQILLDWEAAIGTLADQVDRPVYFDAGHEDAVARIADAIRNLKADLKFLEQGVADRDAQIASLEREVGGQSESLSRVNEALAKRDRERARFERVEALFEPDEAMVLRQSDSVILRLIGLNFASGSSRLGPEHESILGSVQRALADYPEANLVIEGHTDSFGSDASNQSLSQTRADSVRQYLLGAASLSPAAVQALGYGESQPVANNETPEGRQRNRRIDIVIYPKW